MNTKYAYSLNGTDWRGEFGSRKEARAAALGVVKELANPPGEVYVGKMTATDPQISGHALGLIRAINQRTELSGKQVYLTGIKVGQVEELDRELMATLTNWMTKNHLEPAASVTAISEYPVPLTPAVKSSTSDEVRDLGETRWTQEA